MQQIDVAVAQRQAEFIEELEDKLAELKGQQVPEEEPQTRLNVNIPQTMHRQLKGICSLQGLKITDVVYGLIEGYIKAQGK
jgi:hypothetical protein